MTIMRRLIPMAMIAGVVVCLGAVPSARAKSAGGAAVSKEQGPIPEAQLPAYIKAAVNSPDRPAADRALDPGRKPAQLMAFFGIKPGMKVADLSAGGGWTTELLALIVGPNGKVYSQNSPKFLKHFAKADKQWRARLKQPALSNVVPVVKDFNSQTLLPVQNNSLDAVLINMNYHDLVGHGVNMRRFNTIIYHKLKPGGIYGIVDNSAKRGAGASEVSTLHRIAESYVINQVAEVGASRFRLEGTSSVLRNPKDDRTWFIMKHRGQQDRFILKFVKPPSVYNLGGH